jgi:flagellar biosynthetic protein FliP
MLRHIALSWCLAIPALAAASEGPLGITQVPGKNGGGLGMPMQIALSLTLLTLLPGIIMCLTPFLRIVTVLHFLRQALGTQTAPSNQVLLGLGLFLSLLIVQPVAKNIYDTAWVPLEQGRLTVGQAIDTGTPPMRQFLLKFAREKDIALFLDISHAPAPKTPADIDLNVLIPAYILSELKAGFQIGAVLFVLVDGWNLVIGSLMRSFYS